MPARRIVTGFGILLLVALGAPRANADPITISAGFIASGFESGAPFDPVTGSFTITFDNSTNVLNQTTGLVYRDLNLALDSAPAFAYAPSSDTLVLGADLNGATEVGTGTNDFFFDIDHASTAPVAGPVFVHSQASGFRTFTGGVALTPFVAPTPEPATLILLGTAGAAVMLRRRRSAQR